MCLKAHAEVLEPRCAAFLLGSPQPSPAPADDGRRGMSISLSPKPVSFPAPLPSARTEAPKQPEGEAQPPPRTGGVFSIMTSSNGHEQRFSGSIGPDGVLNVGGPRIAAPSSMMRLVSGPSFSHLLGPREMPSLGSMLGLMAPELGAIFDQLEREEEEEPEEPQHPCATEVNACIRERHSTAREAVEGCLVQHFEKLSRECKCFVHHVTGGKVPSSSTSAPAPVAAANRPAAFVHAVPVGGGPTLVRTVAVPSTSAPARVERAQATVAEEPHEPHPIHRLSCLFVFTGLFLAFFLVVRACLVFCSGPAPKTRVVVVPPEHATIRTIAPHPMLVAEQPGANKEPVQVAEPFRK